MNSKIKYIKLIPYLLKKNPPDKINLIHNPDYVVFVIAILLPQDLLQ